MTHDKIGTFETVQESTTTTAPAADADLLTQEFTREAYVTKLRVAAGEANVFEVVVRDQNGANPEVVDRVRLSSAGQEVQEGSIEDEVLHVPADQELVVQPDDGGSAGVDYEVSLAAKEREQ